ncbi:MAG TPA: HlyD family efflux transporter periplasmic adaptor subunit [Caulobacteraceae bacterium]|nr:HlyD family efflux transporter periplasmic adaptor subunit [Caulobacteraceae bacterium]
MAERRAWLNKWRARAARRPLIVVGALAAGLILALVALRGGHGPAAAEQSQVVEAAPFASTIAVVGTVVPDQSLAVTAPLPGAVRKVEFEYGAPVVAGQVLARIDDADAVQRRDEARSTYLKAVQDWKEMADWPSSPDASRDRRAEALAAYDLADTRRKAVETRRLLDRGLVARDEYDALLSQQKSQEAALAGTRQELAVTMERGRGTGREVAALELREARAQLAELEGEVGGAVIRAPAAGVIVRPPADKESASGQIHVGQSLAKGQLIGSIARTGALAVSFQLSETDANAVRPGMSVSVTGPGFGGEEIDGKVTSVAGEASPSSGAGGPLATFAATARLDPLTPDQARTVRIGMTANITVATYSAERALTVPPAAVRGAAPAATVEVKGPFGRRTVRVRIGHVGPDGVEILSGLQAGDTVVWTAPAPSS